MIDYEELNKKYADSVALANKHEEMVVLMNRWLDNLLNGKSVTQYFVRKGYQKIAIYGTSYLSQRLQQELEATDICISLIFDKNSIEKIENQEGKIDVIVITSLYYYYEIWRTLKKVTECPIICIDDIIYKI